MREATNEVQNRLATPNLPGSSMHERMVVANLDLHILASIDDQSRETLEYIKQEDAMEFEITMTNVGKSFKKLSARRNSIVKNLWMAKTKAYIVQTFIDDDEYGHNVFKASLPIFA